MFISLESCFNSVKEFQFYTKYKTVKKKKKKNLEGAGNRICPFHFSS